MTFDFTDPRLVLAGTVYGEARGGEINKIAIKLHCYYG